MYEWSGVKLVEAQSPRNGIGIPRIESSRAQGLKNVYFWIALWPASSLPAHLKAWYLPPFSLSCTLHLEDPQPMLGGIATISHT